MPGKKKRPHRSRPRRPDRELLKKFDEDDGEIFDLLGLMENAMLKEPFDDDDVDDEVQTCSAPSEWPLPELHEGEITSDESMEIILRHHPDLARMMRKGTLPDELIDENGNEWNPFMHLQLHEMIESQLAVDKPAGIRSAAMRMEQEKKLNQHDIRHVIAAALTQQIWNALNKQLVFDEAQYFRDIDKNYQEWLAAKYG